MFQILRKADQIDGQFNGGAILEKKPIGFPQDKGKLKPYSNLFYWAYAWSNEGSTIGLHPHKGFEIMTFVLEGEIYHYDTQINKWKNIKKGDVQIIRAGNGISHAERMEAGSQMFQIWFDPDLSKSMSKPASYDDYAREKFPHTNENGDLYIHYVGNGSPVEMDSDVMIQEVFLSSGMKDIRYINNYSVSIFIIEGSIEFEDQNFEKGDFFISKEKNLNITVLDNCRIFLIYTPVKVDYETYTEKYL